MSTKIDSPTALSSLASVPPARAKAASADVSLNNAIGSSEDKLSLTGDAMQLQDVQRALSAAPAIDTQKVDAVKQALAAGTYRIDPQAITDGLMRSEAWLGG